MLQIPTYYPDSGVDELGMVYPQVVLVAYYSRRYGRGYHSAGPGRGRATMKDAAAVVVACADPDMTHKTTFSPDYLHTMHSVVELAQQQIASGGAGEN